MSMITKTLSNPVSTPMKLKTLGGETKTYVLEGVVVGFIFGLVLSVLIILSYEITNTATAAKNLQSDDGLLNVYPIVIAALCFVFWVFAGALVGIGIPKINLNPDQGRIEKWKMTTTRDGFGEYTKVYNPEKNRNS